MRNHLNREMLNYLGTNDSNSGLDIDEMQNNPAPQPANYERFEA